MPKIATDTTLQKNINPDPHKTEGESHQQIPVVGMHASGRAIGRLASGRPIYIKGGIPGEKLTLFRDRGRQGYHSGSIREIIEPSPFRKDPHCPHAPACGACPWGHIAYEGQLRFKRDMVLQAFRKYEIPLPETGYPPVHPSPLSYHYRNKAQFGYGPDLTHAHSAASPTKKIICGFHPEDDPGRLFDCTSCALIPPSMTECAAKAGEIAVQHGISPYHFASRTGLLRGMIMRSTRRGDVAAIPLFTSQDPAIIPFMEACTAAMPKVNIWYYAIATELSMEMEFIHYAGPAYLHETAGKLGFDYHPAAFYQPNPYQAENLFDEVARQAQPTHPDAFIYDLYTGIGSLASAIAARYPSVRILGIEGNPAAILDARRNAAANGLSRLEFLTGDILETFTPEFLRRYPQPDVIVLDPPRSGTLIEIKKTILAARPHKIVYVSCNPVSLAWDLKQLLDSPYRLLSLQSFDMFPHTQHVETVATLA